MSNFLTAGPLETPLLAVVLTTVHKLRTFLIPDLRLLVCNMVDAPPIVCYLCCTFFRDNGVDLFFEKMRDTTITTNTCFCAVSEIGVAGNAPTSSMGAISTRHKYDRVLAVTLAA